MVSGDYSLKNFLEKLANNISRKVSDNSGDESVLKWCQ